ncbi:MAG: hypothetical protein JHD02_00320 [Thermoleophilaceae bacterium]|nr:hypothetical protein [Thermoleophilaceae bacterium]
MYYFIPSPFGLAPLLEKADSRDEALAAYEQKFGAAAAAKVDKIHEGELRHATLEDVTDDCPLCLALAEKINAGNAPLVIALEDGVIELQDGDGASILSLSAA